MADIEFRRVELHRTVRGKVAPHISLGTAIQDPNTELIEPVNASAPYHHVTKGFLDTIRFLHSGIRIISQAKCENRKIPELNDILQCTILHIF